MLVVNYCFVGSWDITHCRAFSTVIRTHHTITAASIRIGPAYDKLAHLGSTNDQLVRDGGAQLHTTVVGVATDRPSGLERAVE
jgi:hypothetical protein